METGHGKYECGRPRSRLALRAPQSNRLPVLQYIHVFLRGSSLTVSGLEDRLKGWRLMKLEGTCRLNIWRYFLVFFIFSFLFRVPQRTETKTPVRIDILYVPIVKSRASASPVP